ncbi:DNA polymerase III subunit delta [Tomitella cavernea]|uniref:DNA-directed DNA polymerase n=1 Tax=Tomitella cavernea TaxID=1387982 RepID=A0ABP9CUT4_9ACTN
MARPPVGPPWQHCAVTTRARTPADTTTAPDSRSASGGSAGGAAPATLHLVLGDEELLIERAVGGVLAAVRAASGEGRNLQATRLRAGEVAVNELAEMLSPSLFGEDRIIVLDAAGEAGKEPAKLVADTATDLPDGVYLVVVHSGGGRAKSMVPALKKAGAQVHDCAKLKSQQRGDFVRGEFRSAGVRAAPDVVEAVLAAVGSDLRELASACSQLVADTGGKVDAAAVRKYYEGRAEVSGFDVADKAVAGDRAAALEALRWALQRGTAHVPLADALADAVHTIARVGAAGRGDPYSMAGSLGMPPWKIKKAQAQLRGWRPETIGRALQVVATLNGDVKGGSPEPDYALERAVLRVCELRGG